MLLFFQFPNQNGCTGNDYSKIPVINEMQGGSANDNIYCGKRISLICCLILGFFPPSKKYVGVGIKKKRNRRHACNVYKAKKKCYGSVNEQCFQCFRFGRLTGMDVIKGIRTKQLNSPISSLTMLPYGSVFPFSLSLSITDLGKTNSN